MTVTVRLTAPTDSLFTGAAALFDEYRQHYGANPAPEAVAAWMLEQVLSTRARIYVAVGAGGADSGSSRGAPLEPGRGAVAYGICSIAVVPAALTLRTVWLIRDLFVVPAARHRGVGRALLAHVAREARDAGAHRLSLQTETANVRAIELYAKNGFDVLTDVAVMDRVLQAPR